MDSLSPTVFSRTGWASWSLPVAVLPTLFLLGTFAAGISQAQKYTVAKLETLPGGTSTSAARMNKAGEVVGSADDGNGNTVAVAWENAAPTVLFPDLLSYYSYAVGINNQGVVVGNDDSFLPTVFEVGPNINASQSFNLGISFGAINDANVIVGQSGGHPVIWYGVDIEAFGDDSLPTIGYYFDSLPSGINNAGVIVGTEDEYLPPEYINTYPRAVRWEPDPITHAPGATVKALVGLGGMDSSASAVNASDWVVGWATLGNKLGHAVLWEGNNGPFDLGTLGGKQSSAGGINAEGDVAGSAQTASGAWHAVLWTHLDFKATDLNLEISGTLAKEFTLTSAVDTNDRCMVLANGFDNKTGAQESFVLSLTEQSHCDEP
jgi:probable HAF family extracellular repeat protein